MAAGEQPVGKIIDIDKLFNIAITNLYKRYGGTTLVEKNLFDISNNVLQQGLNKTFKSAGATFGKQNELFINEFKTNQAIFSAFKSHVQTKEIVGMLTKEDGTLRSFSEFKKEVLRISEDYNKVYLQTEYNTGVRAARMAANFKQFERSIDHYPNLIYLPSRSASPRDAHIPLYGTIRPMYDPFWDEHMPPSDWNCKCGIGNTDKEVTELPDDMPEVFPVFRNNPGKSASMVNIEEHPYYLETDPKLRDRVIQWSRDNNTL